MTEYRIWQHWIERRKTSTVTYKQVRSMKMTFGPFPYCFSWNWISSIGFKRVSLCLVQLWSEQQTHTKCNKYSIREEMFRCLIESSEHDVFQLLTFHRNIQFYYQSFLRWTVKTKRQWVFVRLCRVLRVTRSLWNNVRVVFIIVIWNILGWNIGDGLITSLKYDIC